MILPPVYAWVALASLAALVFYLATGIAAGRARGKFGVAAPAMTGHPDFERAVRVQANTLEWLVIFLPAMWLYALYAEPRSAAGLGLVWVVGRLLYMRGYMKEASKRGPGFLIQALATLALLLGAIGGVLLHLIHRVA